MNQILRGACDSEKKKEKKKFNRTVEVGNELLRQLAWVEREGEGGKDRGVGHDVRQTHRWVAPRTHPDRDGASPHSLHGVLQQNQLLSPFLSPLY